MDGIVDKYKELGIRIEYMGLDEDVASTNVPVIGGITKHYLYLILNLRFKVVKVGVTSISEEDLIKRYESAIGRVDKLAMYEIKNGN